jgi:hypothetical protein
MDYSELRKAARERLRRCLRYTNPAFLRPDA